MNENYAEDSVESYKGIRNLEHRIFEELIFMSLGGSRFFRRDSLLIFCVSEGEYWGCCEVLHWGSFGISSSWIKGK